MRPQHGLWNQVPAPVLWPLTQSQVPGASVSPLKVGVKTSITLLLLVGGEHRTSPSTPCVLN